MKVKKTKINQTQSLNKPSDYVTPTAFVEKVEKKKAILRATKRIKQERWDDQIMEMKEFCNAVETFLNLVIDENRIKEEVEKLHREANPIAVKIN